MMPTVAASSGELRQRMGAGTQDTLQQNQRSLEPGVGL